MKRLTIMSLFGVLALGLVAAAYPLATANTDEAERSDCPGKVFCPLTGQEVCKDQCTLTARATETDATRADCPGQIDCPLTEELVCRAKCLAIAAAKPGAMTALASEEEAELPACCRNEK